MASCKRTVERRGSVRTRPRAHRSTRAASRGDFWSSHSRDRSHAAVSPVVPEVSSAEASTKALSESANWRSDRRERASPSARSAREGCGRFARVSSRRYSAAAFS